MRRLDVAARVALTDKLPGALWQRSTNAYREMYRLQRITTADDMTRLAGDWNALAAGVPFRRWDWLEAWWRHFGPGQPFRSTAQLCTDFVYALDRDGALVGVAPWHVERTASQGRVVRFLGSGAACSEYLTILAAPGHEAAVARTLAECLSGESLSLADWLTDERADAWDLVELSSIDPTEPTVRLLLEDLAERGASVFYRAGEPCWRLDLPATWDEYLARLSKSHRKQVRRLERRALATGRAVVRDVTDAAELEFALDALVDMQRRRRKQRGEATSFVDPRFVAFLQDASARMLAAGLLRMHWVEAAGRPVAVEHHLAGREVVYAYQGAIEPDALDEEPGRLATIATLRRAIAEGYRAFDFLRGDEPYKRHWRAARRDTIDVRIVPRSVAAHVRHGARVAGENMKQWIKSGLKLSGARSE